MPIVFYDSIKEFETSLPDASKVSQRYFERDRWAGNKTFTEARDGLWSGDNDALQASDKIMEQVEGEGLELAQSYWDNDRTGFIPCVPSYLAGSPESMRRLTEMQTETAPIQIFVDVCLSAGFTDSQLAKRGAAILALARKLSAIRQVELSVYASMHGLDARDGYKNCAIPVIKLDTNPLDLTTASFIMANASFLRRLCFVWGAERGFDGSWAWNSRPDENRERLIEYLNVGEKDLIIDGAYYSDELMKNPTQWVNSQVRRFANILDDETQAS